MYGDNDYSVVHHVLNQYRNGATEYDALFVYLSKGVYPSDYGANTN